ncbi:hypothetical protein WKK05_15315 [Nostoc sp. UHCC 0302]|uniref:hypothetical protein n=1 Tax=Nostoc sp. UHCC 0302 TaxID=3134896 RepID=UPI00311C96A0
MLFARLKSDKRELKPTAIATIVEKLDLFHHILDRILTYNQSDRPGERLSAHRSSSIVRCLRLLLKKGDAQGMEMARHFIILGIID